MKRMVMKMQLRSGATGADRPSIAIGVPSWFWKTTLFMGTPATRIRGSREHDRRFKGGEVASVA